jgi:hypothetical protein
MNSASVSFFYRAGACDELAESCLCGKKKHFNKFNADAAKDHAKYFKEMFCIN